MKTILSLLLALNSCAGWAGTFRVVRLDVRTRLESAKALKTHFEPWNGEGLKLAEVIGTIFHVNNTIVNAVSISKNMQVNLQWHEEARLFAITLEEHFTDRPSFVETGIIFPSQLKNLLVHESHLRKFIKENEDRQVTMEQVMKAFDGRLN